MEIEILDMKPFRPPSFGRKLGWLVFGVPFLCIGFIAGAYRTAICDLFRRW